MKKRATVAVGLLAVVGVGLLIVHHVRKNSALEQGQTANAAGIVNPDSAKAGMTTQPQPQVSPQTFEPPPSAITGSYKEPATKKDSTKKNSAK